MSKLPDLSGLDWRKLEPHERTENPLRLYLGVPQRDDDGCLFVAPVAWAPMPEDISALHALAADRAVEVMGRKVNGRKAKRRGKAA